MRRFSGIILISLALAGVAGQRAATSQPTTRSSDRPPEVSDIARNYTHLTLLTPKPVEVDPQLGLLCANVSQGHVEYVRKKHGPHAYTTVNIFMNKLAADAFAKSTVPYPVGSVIVKEKKPHNYRSDSDPDQTIQPRDGVGGMIKRPTGYDAAHGDWEYFYFEDPEKIEKGKIESCVKCHNDAAKKDHVFGDWKEKKSEGPD